MASSAAGSTLSSSVPRRCPRRDARLLMDGWHLLGEAYAVGLPSNRGGGRSRSPAGPAILDRALAAGTPVVDVSDASWTRCRRCARLRRGPASPRVRSSTGARSSLLPPRWWSPRSACRIQATSARSSGPPTPAARPVCCSTLTLPIRGMEGAARGDGQHISGCRCGAKERRPTTLGGGSATALAGYRRDPHDGRRSTISTSPVRWRSCWAVRVPAYPRRRSRPADLRVRIPMRAQGGIAECRRRRSVCWSTRPPASARTVRDPDPLMSLFDTGRNQSIPAPSRSPERMRPRTLDEVVGQDELIGPGTSAARDDRARPAAVDHPVGPARHRQDHAGARGRRAPPRRLRRRSARCSPASRRSKR